MSERGFAFRRRLGAGNDGSKKRWHTVNWECNSLKSKIAFEKKKPNSSQEQIFMDLSFKVKNIVKN